MDFGATNHKFGNASLVDGLFVPCSKNLVAKIDNGSLTGVTKISDDLVLKDILLVPK